MPEVGRLRKTIYSLADYKRLYDRLRTKYFMDPGPAEDGKHVPPLSNELQWYWLPPQHSALAMTQFDEDGDPESIGWDPITCRSYHFMRYLMLHEMTHMRIGPKWYCGQLSHKWLGARVPRNSLWHAETQRLLNLGALTL